MCEQEEKEHRIWNGNVTLNIEGMKKIERIRGEIKHEIGGENGELNNMKRYENGEEM